MARLSALLTAVRPGAAKATAAGGREWLSPNARGTGPAEVEVLVGDAGGRVIGEIAPEIVGVAWKLNNYGQARMMMASAEAGRYERLLRFGNRVLIRFSNGLPDWGGVIDTPRRWGEDGRVEVVAYSGEYLLTWRITDRGRYFTTRTIGEIFLAVLSEMEPLGVEVGYVWVGGGTHGPDYHYESVFDIAEASLTRRLESADWDVLATLEQGRIRFAANLYQRKGFDYAAARPIALVEGINVLGSMGEQGPIMNDIYLAGSGTGWGDETRIYARAADANSQVLYGLRQRGEMRVDVSLQATLDNAARLRLAETQEPRGVFSLEARDRRPGRFAEYGVGDTLPLEMFSVGMGGAEAAVRIVAREYRPAAETASLVVEMEER